MPERMREETFLKAKPGQVWTSTEEAQRSYSDYTILWIVKDYTHPHQRDEDTIVVHQFDKKDIMSEKTNFLRLNWNLGQNTWLNVGYGDMELELSDKDPNRLLIWAIFEAETIKGKI